MAWAPSLADIVGIVEWGRFDAMDSLLRRLTEEGRRTMGEPAYAIAGTWLGPHTWKKQHSELGHVSYLTKERAEIMLAQGAEKGILHRAPGWETSEAREFAERLEG